MSRIGHGYGSRHSAQPTMSYVDAGHAKAPDGLCSLQTAEQSSGIAYGHKVMGCQPHGVSGSEHRSPSLQVSGHAQQWALSSPAPLDDSRARVPSLREAVVSSSTGCNRAR